MAVYLVWVSKSAAQRISSTYLKIVLKTHLQK